MSEPILMPFQHLPFNGDTFVCNEFLRLKKLFDINVAVETGSCLYSTTKWLGENFDNVYTVEINADFAKYGSHKVLDMNNVNHTVGMSSINFIKEVLSEAISDSDRCLYFLDAHWGNECPLLGELEGISKIKTHQKPVIIIHDFKVPDEPNLGFDDIHGQPFEYGWIKPYLEAIYGLGGYDYYYNNDSTSTEIKRGLIYIVPKVSYDE